MKPTCLPASSLLLFEQLPSLGKKCLLAFTLLLPGILLSSQELSIQTGANLVLKGNVSLILNNAAFKNNGSFAAGSSTVYFSGHNDTTLSYINGSSYTRFNNMSVIKTAYGVAIKSAVGVADVLTVSSGNLYTDSNLTLLSDASLTARVDVIPPGCNIYGKTHVERYIPARRAWRLMTAPVTSSSTVYNTWQNRGVYAPGLGLLITGPGPTAGAGNGLDYSAMNTVSMKGFNYSTQQFVNMLNTKVAISPGSNGSADNAGYFVFVRGDRDPANTTVPNVNTTTMTSIGTLQIGTQTYTASPVSGKYTLIGNPYASPVDFETVTRNNVLKRFIIWDPWLNTVGGYVMLDDLDDDGIFSKSVPASPQTRDIQSSQAFFVQTDITAPATVIFEETSKSSNNNNLVSRPVRPASTTGNGTGKIIASLNLLNAANKTILADGVIAEFDDIYNAGVDLDDAEKFTNTNENISIVRNNVSLCAERRPALSINDTVYFKLSTTTQRNYQFVFEVSGLEQPGIIGFLEDSYLKTSTLVNLSGITKVNFSINAQAASAAANRFMIVFKPVAPVLPVTFSSIKAYERNQGIQVDWKVEHEINMVKYDVEQSADGVVFSHAYTVSVTGLSNTYNTYGWLDVTTRPGSNFYRIKAYSNTGEITYSTIVKVVIGKNGSGFTIYPNPVKGNVIRLLMNAQPAGKYQVSLVGPSGQVVLEEKINHTGGSNTESLNTGIKLPAGNYQLKVTAPTGNQQTLKMIIE